MLSRQCEVCRAQSRLFSVKCAMPTVNCSVRSVQCPLCTAGSVGLDMHVSNVPWVRTLSNFMPERKLAKLLEAQEAPHRTATFPTQLLCPVCVQTFSNLSKHNMRLLSIVVTSRPCRGDLTAWNVGFPCNRPAGGVWGKHSLLEEMEKCTILQPMDV